MSPEERKQLHRQFWDGQLMPVMPASFRLGDYFFANKFDAAKPLLEKNRRLDPDDLIVDLFLPDYERMYQEVSQIGQTGFWVAEPLVAIPWLEAMLGCSVFGSQDSFYTRPPDTFPDLAQVRNGIRQNRWFLKYMEFVEKFLVLSRGRFPVGQPITRGVSDMLGALYGQEPMIFAMADSPDQVKATADHCTHVFLDLMAAHHQACARHQAASGLGFYHIWTPEPGIWFQEDLSAILSPTLYREIIKPYDERICQAYPTNMMHLHSSSFHLLDDLLAIQGLKAVEINKDIGGLSTREMALVFQSILDHSLRLVIWGTLDQDDLDFLIRSFPPRGIFLNLVAGNLAEARQLAAILANNS